MPGFATSCAGRPASNRKKFQAAGTDYKAWRVDVPPGRPDLSALWRGDAVLAKNGSGEARSAQAGAACAPRSRQVTLMGKDIVHGQWDQLRRPILQRWDRLTGQDLDRIEGNYEKLVGTIQSRYGQSREDAERELADFMLQFDPQRIHPV